VVTLWYTAAGGNPSVRYATSTDGGTHFGDAQTLASDAGTLGRVAVSSDGRGAWFAWLDEADGRQQLRVARREWAAPEALAPRTLAMLGTHGNGAGMPRLASTQGATYAVWTDSANGAPRLVGTRL
jgi:hypothetical protein